MIANVHSIIFIHGCTGDREKNWTSQEKVFWPRDLLSKDVPTARILTWGYDASLFFSVSRDQLLDVTLARDLKTWRKKTVTPVERPIIFVAHGIGGLILEQVRYYVASRVRKT